MLYTFDKQAREYVSDTGRRITRDEVRALSNEIIASTRDRLHVMTEQVARGEITRPQWQLLFAKELKNAHTTMAVLGRGGLSQMRASDWGRVGGKLKSEYRYLREFATFGVPRNIRDRAEMVDYLAARGEAYTRVLSNVFENSARAADVRAGDMEERRTLGATVNPCEDCQDAADMGWQPGGTLPEIGDSSCGPGCQCEFETREVGAGGVDDEESDLAA